MAATGFPQLYDPWPPPGIKPIPVAVSRLRRPSRAVLARRVMQNGAAWLSRLDPSVSRPDG